MWFAVIPLVLAVGVVVAALALVLGVLVRVAIELMPLLLLGLGLWLLFGSRHRARRRKAARQHRAERGRTHPPRPVRPVSSAPPAHQTPSPPPRVERPELPVDVKVKAEQIKRKAEVLQSYAHRFPPLSQDLYIVRQTASDYLPRTLKAYLSLPPGAGERMVTASGKTALEELRDQLQIMDAKLDDIAEDLQRRDLAGLMENRHFLEERFGVRGVEDDASREEDGTEEAEVSSTPAPGPVREHVRADAA